MKRRKRGKKAEAQRATVPAVNKDKLGAEKKIRLRAFQHIAHPKKRRLLIAYAETGTLCGACRLAGMDWRMHYNWLDADKDYADSFERAKAMAADHGEDIVYECAFEGYDKPVTYEGEITATYKQPSDLLAMFWLKGARPEKYREDSRLQVNINVPPAVNIVPPTAIAVEEESKPLLAELSEKCDCQSDGPQKAQPGIDLFHACP